MAPIPKAVKYLLPLIAALDNMPVDDLNDDNVYASTLIHTALQERIEGLDDMAAEARSRAQANSSAASAFVAGYLLFTTAADLQVDLPSPSIPKSPEIRFVPPDGFREVPCESGRQFKFGKNLQLFASCITGDVISSLKTCTGDILEKLHAALPGMPLFSNEEVQFGESVFGIKRREIIEECTAGLHYFLEVPNGHVSISLFGSRVSRVDLAMERQLEQSLCNLRLG